ncbi:hypothetical protein Rxyl_1088 [Rubrobacter xylanophilus DSM 9941]|uniref:Uncharacterized protein n=1 Tax=Rubrobacter xylanophilus (strain DSM 9941 / JCM 11954 / NBRC 16129 / PRD-1) TaxID=266117 RepID=Q1AX24_RUBXD|nr:hypothetical protein [Rubrobacter xylanophilus]ABG04054.1 hypothetical protein Rxyl_1088 [Rubrobacter xylanophilus DSM 9941]
MSFLRRGRRGVRVAGALSCGLVLAFAALLLGSGGRSPGAEEAGPPPGKPVFSFLLSDPETARSFRKEFGLDRRQMGRALEIARREAEALGRLYAGSEGIVAAAGEVPVEEIRERIARSGYNARVRAVAGATRARLLALLPPGSGERLDGWVGRRWALESRRARAENTYQLAATGVTCRVYATWYRGYTRYEVALPHKKLKFDGGYRVRISHQGHRAWAPVKEVGPWNTRDNYWQSRRYRDMWDDLPRCVPEAQAAYFNNYNGGKDQFGRQVLNPAGVDLTLAVAGRMGIKRKLQNRGVIRVYVYYPWVRR